ncbi:TlpA disulfide reductase family protein [uncultured Oribacterium sp.]|uniref:TlpA family protein disulfide reductase n=1 Tax=uncultured Oribacterium sp. TaxID=462198 RepID=UPI0028062921|nr:TlpA disulfide reductase family protein [uncultured Oribacterium sp.]
MRKNQFTGACLVTTLCLGLGLTGCQNKVATEQKSSMAVSENADAQSLAVSPEDAGVSINMDNNGDSFKPADYTLPVKDEYVYEYLGLKFKLSEKIREAMKAKDIVMLDDQSPIDQELKYGLLSFSKLTEEQKNAEVSKMGDGYEKWQESLERIGTIGMFEKSLSEDEIGKITKCDSHTKLGESKDGKYSYYLSVNSTADAETIEELKQTTVEITEKKDRPENGFVLSEKSDLENTMAFSTDSQNVATDLSNLQTVDIDGKEFSGKDFSDYDLTMVNVFATWCSPCVQEIPDLAEIQKEMKDKGVNIVGVVTDTVDQTGENQEALEKAKLIRERSKAEYPFLIPDKSNFNGRLSGIQAFPETFFVDKKGQIVGETYSGSHNKKAWLEIIEKELAKVKR